ncbi:contractile injection system protein, VgrG/Pvc8 family [Comamonadaceae bacterium PP-2]
MSDIADIQKTLALAQSRGGRGRRPAGNLRPAWRVTVKGRDVSARLAPRLVSLSITDNRENEADEVEIVVSDHDGALELPETGDELTVAIGWEANGVDHVTGTYGQAGVADFPLGLVDKGSYTIQAVEYSGTPDVITIRARAADLIDSLRNLKDRSWHKTTVGAVVRAIASQNKLTAIVAAEIAKRTLDHADQADESDASFLRRLARQFDCLCNVKNGRLLFSQARAARTPSGTALPPARIVRSDGDSHRYARSDRDAYSGVKAFYNSAKGGTRSSVVAGISGRAKSLKHTFANKADALAAARAEWLRIQRGIFSFDITLAYGRADLMPQRPVVVSGYKRQIDETAWIITDVRHSLSSSGYSSTITLETLQAEGVEGEEGAEDAE